MSEERPPYGEHPLGDHPKERAFRDPEAHHECPERLRHRGAGPEAERDNEDAPERLWGSAVTRIEKVGSRWWAHNDEYATEISFCPWCGNQLESEGLE